MKKSSIKISGLTIFLLVLTFLVLIKPGSRFNYMLEGKDLLEEPIKPETFLSIQELGQYNQDSLLLVGTPGLDEFPELGTQTLAFSEISLKKLRKQMHNNSKKLVVCSTELTEAVQLYLFLKQMGYGEIKILSGGTTGSRANKNSQELSWEFNEVLRHTFVAK